MTKKEIVAALNNSMERTLAACDWDEKTLGRSYGKGKWNGKQILAHLADCELHFLTRMKFILAEHSPAIVPFEQDDWAKKFKYENTDVTFVKETFRILRQNLIAVTQACTEADLKRAGKHPQRPDYTAGWVAEHAAEHTDHHLEQLDATKAGKSWAPKK
jgi:uncharacterized damage-inducible protein DinB